MEKHQIKLANNNKERQETYRRQLGRYNCAMRNEFYFEALMIVYSMLEDRLKSFLYYCGVFANRNTMRIYKNVRADVLEIVYNNTVPDRLPSLNSIQNKILYVKSILMWADSVITDSIAHNQYLLELKSQIEFLDIGALLECLDNLSSGNTAWLKFRNEIIHASMNKNIEALYENLGERVQEGMECARCIDSQVQILKKKGKVRKKLGMQNN